MSRSNAYEYQTNRTGLQDNSTGNIMKRHTIYGRQVVNLRDKMSQDKRLFFLNISNSETSKDNNGHPYPNTGVQSGSFMPLANLFIQENDLCENYFQVVDRTFQNRSNTALPKRGSSDNFPE